MKTNNFIEKVEKSQDFKEFIKEDQKAYLCSMFLVRDFAEKHNETHIDFYSPKSDKIVSFKVNGKIERIPLDKKAETMEHKKFVPKKLDPGIKLNVEDLKPIILDEMQNRGIFANIQKILVVLQNHDERNVWNCTCFLSGLALLHTRIEDSSESVLFMEKQSFFDIMKVITKKPEETSKEVKKETKPKKKIQEKKK